MTSVDEHNDERIHRFCCRRRLRVSLVRARILEMNSRAQIVVVFQAMEPMNSTKESDAPIPEKGDATPTTQRKGGDERVGDGDSRGECGGDGN